MTNTEVVNSAIVPVEKTGHKFIEFFKYNRFFRYKDTEVLLITENDKDSDFCSRFICNDYGHQSRIRVIQIESGDRETFIPRALNTGALMSSAQNAIFISQNCYIYGENWDSVSRDIQVARTLWGPQFYFKPEIIHTLSSKDLALPMNNQADFLFSFKSHKIKIEKEFVYDSSYWFDFLCMDRKKFLSMNGFNETPEWNFGSNNIEKRLSTIRIKKYSSDKVRGIHLGEPTSNPVYYSDQSETPLLREMSGEHPQKPEVEQLNIDRKPKTIYDWTKSPAPHDSAKYHHIDQKLHDLLMSEEYNNLDVLHLGFFFFQRHSLFKIVQNVVHHAKLTKQKWLSLQDHKIEDVFEFCNIVKPRIIHIHFAEIIDKSVFQFLNYNPTIIGTMHSEKLNPYYESIDFLICISELSSSYNRGPRKIIENTVWVDDHLVREEIDERPDFCLTARFSPFVLSKDTLKVYSNIDSDVWIYGYTQDDRALELKNFASKFDNINIIDWDNYVERKVAKHSVFSIIKPVIDSSYQYDMNVMEAVCLGMPSVTTRKRQDYQQYVIDGYNGFVVSDSNEFIEKCNLLAKDQDTFSFIKKNALEHRKHIKNTMPEEYEQVYLKFL